MKHLKTKTNSAVVHSSLVIFQEFTDSGITIAILHVVTLLRERHFITIPGYVVFYSKKTSQKTYIQHTVPNVQLPSLYFLVRLLKCSFHIMCKVVQFY